MLTSTFIKHSISVAPPRFVLRYINLDYDRTGSKHLQ